MLDNTPIKNFCQLFFYHTKATKEFIHNHSSFLETLYIEIFRNCHYT